MAYDKVVDSAVLDAGLKQIADAIREKAGTTDALAFPQEIADAIAAIQSGGATIEPLTISENGTYTAPDGVDGYSPVTVEVKGSGGDLDAYIDGSLTEITSNVEYIREYTFMNYNKLKSVNFPNAVKIGNYAFYRMKSGGEPFVGNFPRVEVIGSYAFAFETSGEKANLLRVANFPCVKTIGEYAFSKNDKLEEIHFPVLEGIPRCAFGSSQSYMKLKKVDFPKVTNIGREAFKRNVNLKTVILRNETVCSLYSATVFADCYHILGEVNSTYNPDGLKDGYFYVPRSLVETYKVATNWATFADQFRAIEDYTVDGTITGEIDESKVGL